MKGGKKSVLSSGLPKKNVKLKVTLKVQCVKFGLIFFVVVVVVILIKYSAGEKRTKVDTRSTTKILTILLGDTKFCGQATVVYPYARERESERCNLKCNKLKLLSQSLQILHTKPLIWPLAAVKTHLVLKVTI